MSERWRFAFAISANCRIRLAVPVSPITTIGTHSRGSMSSSLAMLHGASANSGENRPVTLMPS